LFFFFEAEMQEKVFTELAQNLNSLPPQMRAKGKKNLKLDFVLYLNIR
jgi:hypothetical protein